MTVKAGQHLTSIRKIAAGVGWNERGLWKEPNPKTITEVLKWLEIDGMISLDGGNGKYTLITLVNWRYFQHDEPSEVTVTGYKEKELINKELKDKELSSIYTPERRVKRPVNPKEKLQFLDTVFLTQDQYDRLCSDFGKETTDLFIEKLDEWQTNYPKKKKVDHNKTIRVWIKNENARKKQYPVQTKQQKNEQQMDVLAKFSMEDDGDEQTRNGEVSSSRQNSLPPFRNY
jgi:hypothetical protein